jgi:Na+:H+ antiporter, NhaA family
MRPIVAPLRDFLHRESSSGLLIVAASALGLLIANSPVSKTYFSILDWQFCLGVSDFSISFTVLKFINYVLMTLFFFIVGLEIKRELASGHLASLKKALMPFLAALGGMVVPALIYLLIAGSTDVSGWGVPVATDIALAVGLLALVGSSAVASLRSFLLALAVIDDIGAILIIAIVYSAGVQISWLLGAAAAVVGILFLQRLKVQSTLIYILVGIALWYAMYRSGIHPTLAGVILGLLTPNLPKQGVDFDDIEDGSLSIIEWLEKKIHPWSTYVIVPLFAFANTGVEINSDSIGAAMESPIAWGIFCGLVLGKPIGIFLSTFIAKKIRIGEVPEGAGSRDLIATGSAAGIGFTVAIFITNLAFENPRTEDIAIFAVIVASIVSGFISFVLFKVWGRKVTA